MNREHPIYVHSDFDGGNIIVRDILADNQGRANLTLSIAPDNQSDYFQWFYFRLTGVRDRELSIRIVDCDKAAYPEGWTDYQPVISHDRLTWRRTHAQYEDGALCFTITPESDSVWIAYFAPYSMERHHDLIARCARSPLVTLHDLGVSLDGQAMDCLQVGMPSQEKKTCWMIARQHPGETMAEWWMEGMLDRLLDPHDPVSRGLLEKGVFYIVPNMCPDGARRGHLRTNAAGVNLNREWHAPSPERSPEVYHVLKAMHETGVDFCLDVHGDEALPYNFIAGFDGIPDVDPIMLDRLDAYKQALLRHSPDFQTRKGYDVDAPGKANMSMCTNAVAHGFRALAMTLEMPFKDTVDHPDLVSGWSPDRSRHLGRACLSALLDVMDKL